ncbi:hypothetical protein MLD38_016924 [Melastoma candidum]|uniref:Uncharacterized protein n=1 Tax=Melastoma candidum TaxID=119954 RepID=A0ACB9QT09_9MYRT|nr:hypothetical protein MLD38_016924 [Melastoma candidum]
MEQSRLTLRRFELSDLDDFLKWASDPRVTRYLRWDAVASKGEALSLLEKKFVSHPWRLSVCLDGRSTGYVSARPGTGDDRCRVHVSYAIAAEHWGKGVATAALRMALPRVFGEFLEVRRVEALVEVENGASARVLEKVGFVKEGLLRKYCYCKGEIKDMFIYSFLVTDLDTLL